MPAPDRLDGYANSILLALMADHPALLVLEREAQKLGVPKEAYIAKWVWARAQIIEANRP
jgi:hypothetical protein